MGQLEAGRPVLVRVHAANVLTDAFRAIGAGGVSDVLGTSLRAIAAEGAGAVLYMQPEERAEALLQQSSGAARMRLRDYGIGAQILCALGLTKIRLLTQQRKRIVGLDGYGVEIVEQIEIGRPS
jgi:3,4-dihydroxy 2-butanone 4-phosphate synthase/GTP cyclohydrolase II